MSQVVFALDDKVLLSLCAVSAYVLGAVTAPLLRALRGQDRQQELSRSGRSEALDPELAYVLEVAGQRGRHLEVVVPRRARVPAPRPRSASSADQKTTVTRLPPATDLPRVSPPPLPPHAETPNAPSRTALSRRVLEFAPTTLWTRKPKAMVAPRGPVDLARLRLRLDEQNR